MLRSATNVKSYAASVQPKLKQSDEVDKIPVDIKQILRRVRNLPDEDLTIFVKHAGVLFSHNSAIRNRKQSPEQLARIERPQIKKNVTSASSIEDFLFTPPSPTQSFPAISKLPGIYAGLSKSRLTMLVVLTSMGGYALAPGPFDGYALLFLSVGTWLQSAAANATNQTMEVKYDTQMVRTRNRVLVKGLISREHAAVYAAVAGVAGTSLLYWGVNPLTCYIGAVNYLLYTAVYTPMKRLTPLNTWVGSVVGALPPVMGWTAATGGIDMGALWLGTILYIWQFPHFKALSWNIRNDYQRAGYLMSATTNPPLCKRVAFRHTVYMTAACCLGPVLGVTTEAFTVYSLPCNIYGMYLGWRFYQDGDSKSSRKLFKFSLAQVPYLLGMMLICKNWHKKEETTAQVVKSDVIGL
ncbi:protoheme IX farnesyltransferase, mitochondrial-like isoform X2 [Watersipora subatra]|uniref:protoheme IX farnesyltransferase, mitochondrial-like isoform X2 n=1 Tax=Watersipora subatra TaxID=2589382 RepID=UPI00355C625C